MAMRIRVTFSKTEPMRFTSHLDLFRAWERTLRRASMPILFSQGYNPRPRMQLAAALPLGFTSSCEVIDIWLEDDAPQVSDMKSVLIQVQPPGIEIQDVIEIDPQDPPLQKRVRSAEYMVTLLDPMSQLSDRVANLLQKDTLQRERRGKTYDLRPLIEDLTLKPADGVKQQIFMRLFAQESKTGRPEEVLLALEIPPENTRVHRIKIIFTD
jgi:radical SAM-linked protein